MKKIIKTLLQDIDELVELNIKFHENFNYGKTSWVQWGEYQEWINFNIVTLDAIRKLSVKCLYREAFILTRSVFESYFIIQLSMLGKVAFFNFLPNKGESKEDLLVRAKKGAEDAFGKGNIESIKLIENTDRPYKVEVIYKLKPIKDTDKTLPRHYFFFKEFDSESCYLSGIKFNDNFGERKIEDGHKKFHQNINREFLNMPKAILQFLEINKLATKKQREAILVHYNFLSQFTHGTAESYDTLSNNRQKAYVKSLDEIKIYDYNKELLLLLYVFYLAKYFMDLQVKYFSGESEIKINNLGSIKKQLKKITEKYDFFWFIYNRPFEFDLYDYKMHKMWAGKKPVIKKISEVRYYRNPLSRIIEIHRCFQNERIGNYVPPEILK